MAHDYFRQSFPRGVYLLGPTDSMMDVPGVALKKDPGAGLGKAREMPGPMAPLAPLAMQNPGLSLLRPTIVGPAPANGNQYANPSNLRYLPDARASCIYMNSGAMPVPLPLSLVADSASALVAAPAVAASAAQYSSGYLSQQHIPDTFAAPQSRTGHLWPDSDVRTELLPAPAPGFAAQLRSADTFTGRRQSLLF